MDEMINVFKGSTLQKVSIEQYKREFAQYLQTENLHFLIGSGCSSYNRDGSESAIPTMAGLYKGFLISIALSPLQGKIQKIVLITILNRCLKP